MRAGRWRAVAVAVMGMSLVAGACGVEAGRPVATGADASSSVEVLADVRGSVALIVTPLGTGSAVLLDDGYLLTNAHVVDPYGQVSVTFEGADPIEDVPVIGVDAEADLALVGPVETDAAPAEVVDPVGLDDGSQLYLVGFPGDQEDVEVTFASGVLSRRRKAEPGGMTYLQSDTTIGFGQSGGALVDGTGQVVGISSMVDADGFALSLSGGDVLDRLQGLRDGGDAAWQPISIRGLDSTWTAALDGGWASTYYLPAVTEAGEVSITAPEGTALAMSYPGSTSYPWVVNEVGGAPEAEQFWLDPESIDVVETVDGVWTIEVYDGEDGVLSVAPPDGESSVEVSSSLPMLPVFTLPRSQYVEVGDVKRGVINYVEDWALFEVELEAGRSYEIAARSASGDLYWTIGLEGEDDPNYVDELASADDGGGGLLDHNAVDTFEPDRDGTYFVHLSSYAASPTAYEFSVTRN